MFFRATLGTARSKFAVDHYGGHAADAEGLRLRHRLRFVHIVDYYFMRRTSKPLD